MADPGGVNLLGLIVMVFQVLSVSYTATIIQITVAVGQRRSRANRCARLIVVAQVVPKRAAKPDE